ncbi:MAG TPA: hypothetical protein VF173_22025, partial [Thermoanaerobaculia bacterium]|nr:hypothetical protein [Thermoanaerobaculia bacterium]
LPAVAGGAQCHDLRRYAYLEPSVEVGSTAALSGSQISSLRLCRRYLTRAAQATILVNGVDFTDAALGLSK